MKTLLALLLCLGLVSCTQTNEVVEKVSLSVENLPPLQSGYYQLWVTFYQFNTPAGVDSPMHEGEFVSVGAFNVAADGTLRGLAGGAPTFQLPAGADSHLLKDIVVSVQTQATEQPQSIIMGGIIQGDAVVAFANLSIAYADAFRTNFASATGVCTVVSPTSPPDSNSGAWFVRLGTPLTAGLRNLPALPNGWRYEGWVVQPAAGNRVTYLSTGKFARADSADLDGAGPYAGNAGQPFNFPGQDFIQGLRIPNLLASGHAFMVSVEPVPDNAPEPFFLRVLQSQPIGASASRVQTLNNVIDSTAPKGKVTIRR